MDANRKIVRTAKLYPNEPQRIVEFFASLGEFQVVIEATASDFWFVELVEPKAAAVVLANPAKLRVIAESTKKTDKLDAQVLAEFLARDMIPRVAMPTPRQRQHRALVRHRKYLREQATAVKCKIRQVLADYNADRRDLFSSAVGEAYIKGLKLNAVDRFRLADLWRDWESIEGRLKATAEPIKSFVKQAPQAEAEARALVRTAPGVGTVTAEAVLCELGDIRRFKNAKAVCAYADLVPVVRHVRAAARRPRTAGSRKRARACCVGRWWRRRGGWWRRVRGGVGRMSGSRSVAGRSGRSWLWRGSSCACFTRCCGTPSPTKSSPPDPGASRADHSP